MKLVDRLVLSRSLCVQWPKYWQLEFGLCLTEVYKCILPGYPHATEWMVFRQGVSSPAAALQSVDGKFGCKGGHSDHHLSNNILWVLEYEPPSTPRALIR